MKAAIVTFIRAYNYGATLQCYALAKKLRDLSVDVQVLDYSPKYFEDLYTLSYLGKIRNLPYRPFKNWVYFLPLKRILQRRNNGFDAFIRKNIPLTNKQYKTFDEIDKDTLSHDIFISGSDQVWSNRCVPFDPVYFLQFSSALPEKKYSYAASFGFDSVPTELQEEYQVRLKNWSAYSVRETSAVQICNDLLNVTATQCCDPTLLLSNLEWKALSINQNIKKPFILVYDVNNSSILFQKANELSSVKKLPVYILTSNMYHDSILCRREHTQCFHNLADASPDEWLGWFFSATYVLTDSFHGSVFSLLSHKQFMHISSSPNSRSTDFLKSLGLDDRCSQDVIGIIDHIIPWDNVDEKIEQIRRSSLSYLTELIQERRYSYGGNQHNRTRL